jgi:hypothetical protein
MFKVSFIPVLTRQGAVVVGAWGSIASIIEHGAQGGTRKTLNTIEGCGSKTKTCHVRRIERAGRGRL